MSEYCFVFALDVTRDVTIIKISSHQEIKFLPVSGLEFPLRSMWSLESLDRLVTYVHELISKRFSFSLHCWLYGPSVMFVMILAHHFLQTKYSILTSTLHNRYDIVQKFAWKNPHCTFSFLPSKSS
jgi:hypothetical protein